MTGCADALFGEADNNVLLGGDDDPTEGTGTRAAFGGLVEQSRMFGGRTTIRWSVVTATTPSTAGAVATSCSGTTVTP